MHMRAGLGDAREGMAPELKLRTPLQRLPDATEPLSPHSPLLSTAPRGNESQAVVNLINGVLGAAVLSFAFCTRGMGVLLMLAVIVFAALMNRMSQQLMLYSAALSNKMSYEGIACAPSLSVAVLPAQSSSSA